MQTTTMRGHMARVEGKLYPNNVGIEEDSGHPSMSGAQLISSNINGQSAASSLDLTAIDKGLFRECTDHDSVYDNKHGGAEQIQVGPISHINDTAINDQQLKQTFTTDGVVCSIPAAPDSSKRVGPYPSFQYADPTKLRIPLGQPTGMRSSTILEQSSCSPSLLGPDTIVYPQAGMPNDGPRKPTGYVSSFQIEEQASRTWAGLFKPPSQDVSMKHFQLDSRLNDRQHTSTSPTFNTDSAPSQFNLEFVDHGVKDGSLTLKIPMDLTTNGKVEWSTTLVGRFLGKKLPYSLVTNVTGRLWGTEGLLDTLATDSGYYFFKFSSLESRDAVLEGGPWFVVGQPLLLRPWKPQFSFDNAEVHSIPIWINFYGIPLEYWNPKGISFISSFIGKPIRVDRVTASRRRITYARVCIEVTDRKSTRLNSSH